MKAVLRCKSAREGKSARRYPAREKGDMVDVDAWQKHLEVVGLVLLLVGGCGHDPDSVARAGLAAPAPQWRALDRRESDTGFTLTLPRACRVRFRVVGAEKLLHT